MDGGVGEGRVVAVNSRVGRGVSVGGTGVNVYASVGVFVGASDIAAGWNGVGVADALGFAVTSTSVGGSACMDTGREQDVKIQRRRNDASRREVFMKCYSIIARSP